MLLKLEILLFIISLLYILYYLGTKSYKGFFKLKKIIKKEDIQTKKSALNKVGVEQREKKYNELYVRKELTHDEKNNLRELKKRVKLNTEKGYFDTAKTLIVEGLSIDKFNKDLNLDLAHIYIKETKYQNAEYIYNDLLEIYKDDLSVMKKLAYVYLHQNRLPDALEMYEKVHKKDVTDDEVIDMLAEISYDLKDYKKAIKYVNLYLKSNPRNTDKLMMKAVALETTGDVKESVIMHKKILEVQPYNSFSRDKIRELDGEE